MIVFKTLVAVRWDKEASVFVSFAPDFDLYSQGNTEDEAFRAISSALKMYLVDCYQKNILLDMLRKSGIESVQTDYDPTRRTREFQEILERRAFIDPSRSYEIETNLQPVYS